MKTVGQDAVLPGRTKQRFVLRFSGQEIIEIIIVSAMSMYVDVLADALQIEVDDSVTQALAQMK